MVSFLHFTLSSYEILKDIEGNCLTQETEEVTKSNYCEYIANSVSISNKSYYGNFVDIVSTKDRRIIQYSLKDSKDNMNSNKNNIKYIQLPEEFSTNIRFKKVVDEFGTTGLNNSIILDDDNNLISVLSIDDRNSSNLRIKKTIKLKKEYPVKDLDVIYGYLEKGVEKTILKDKDNQIFVIKNDTFELTKKEDMKEWKTVSAHPHKKIATQEDWDTIYLYQVNDQNSIRKYDFFKNEVSYERKLNKYPIEGRIVRTEYTPFTNSLITLTVSNGDNFICKFGEESIQRIQMKNKAPDGTPLRKIEDFFIFCMDVDGHQEYYIGLYQKDDNNPIILIDLITGWTDIVKQ